MSWEMVDWIQVDQDRVAFRYLTDSIINLMFVDPCIIVHKENPT